MPELEAIKEISDRIVRQNEFGTGLTVGAILTYWMGVLMLVSLAFPKLYHQKYSLSEIVKKHRGVVCVFGLLTVIATGLLGYRHFVADPELQELRATHEAACERVVNAFAQSPRIDVATQAIQGDCAPGPFLAAAIESGDSGSREVAISLISEVEGSE